jgi:hypothetical protein
MFMRSGEFEATVTLNAPCANEVRRVAPNDQVRVLATNLQAQNFPAPLFTDASSVNCGAHPAVRARMSSLSELSGVYPIWLGMVTAPSRCDIHRF